MIRLCGSDYLQHAAMTPLIREMRRRAPKMRLLIAPRPATGVADLLARGEIDLCLSLRELAIPDLPARLLYRDRYICVARKGHPLRDRRITTKQLCTFDHLIVDPTGRSFVGPVDAALAARGHQRRVASAVPSFPLLLEVLQFGDFFAFVPERLLQKPRSDLKTFHTDLAIPPLEVVANWHPRAAGDAQHKWLRDLLAKSLRRLGKTRSEDHEACQFLVGSDWKNRTCRGQVRLPPTNGSSPDLPPRSRLCQIQTHAAQQIRALMREFLYGNVHSQLLFALEVQRSVVSALIPS